MGLLDEAIREHLELRRQHGADEEDIARQEAEVFGPGPQEAEADPDELASLSEEGPSDRAAEAGITGDREEPEFEWHGFGSTELEVPGYADGEEREDNDTQIHVGGTRAEDRVEEERPPEVTDAATELFHPLDGEPPEQDDEEASEEVGASAAGEETAAEEPLSAAQDETARYEAPPVLDEEEPPAEELAAEELAAEELSDGVPVDEAFAAESRLAEARETVSSGEEQEAEAEPAPDESGADAELYDAPAEPFAELGELELSAEIPEDAAEAVEKPLDDAPEGVEDDAPEAQDDALAKEEDLAGEPDLLDLSASLEPSPFARPDEPAETFVPEPTEDPSGDFAEPASAAPIPAESVPDVEEGDEARSAEDADSEAARAPDDTAYLLPEERPLYEPVPDAEARPDEPLDIPPPAPETDPGLEPEPLAESADTELEPEPPEAGLGPEPPETELDVPEPDLDSEEDAEEADPSPSPAFFEDTAQYEGIPPERRPPRDPDFET